MSHYLQVDVGPYALLIEAGGVDEILTIDAAAVAGRRDWRGQTLAAINTRALLGVADAVLPGGQAGVVYRPDADGAAVVLELDQVTRLLRAETGRLLPLPGVPERVARLFDGVVLDPATGAQLYRLRRPLPVAVLIEAAAI